MKLIIGLGNPGKQYANTRHNAGFMVLDEIQKAFSFPEFQMNQKFDTQISEGSKNGEKMILAKPQSFMNLSGEAVKALVDFYKIPLENIAVIHDDLDINLSEYKISADSSAAGHNGVQSIIDSLGTQQFKRIRVGIEGAEKKKERVVPGDVFVLQPFSAEELVTVKNLAGKIAFELKF
jgi:PTH1 family peptidyl-tRNA hydrolase